MRIPCSVVKDILPVYIEKLCSNETNELIENHLQQCRKCKSIYEEMTNESLITGEETVDNSISDPFRKIKRRNRIIVLISVVFTVILISLVDFAYHNVRSIKTLFTPEIVTFTEVSSNEWSRVSFQESDSLKFSSHLYKRRMTSDANNPGTCSVRVLDEKEKTLLEIEQLEPGESKRLNLNFSEKYYVEIKAEEGNYLIRFY